jgi:hypothetical protein
LFTFSAVCLLFLFILTTSSKRVTPSLLIAEMVTALGANVATSGAGKSGLSSVEALSSSASSFILNLVKGIRAKLATPGLFLFSFGSLLETAN